MTYHDRYKDVFRIKTNRLRAWDYTSSGYYFVTICVKDRECLLGEIDDRKMCRSNIGEIIQNCWNDIPVHFNNVQIDEFVVMPNHVHGIIQINNKINPNRRDAINRVSTKLGGITKSDNPMMLHSLGKIIRWFKGKSSYQIHKQHPAFAWQPRYYDHIIRDEESLIKIREYIQWNPLNWETDEENPDRLTTS